MNSMNSTKEYLKLLHHSRAVKKNLYRAHDNQVLHFRDFEGRIKGSTGYFFAQNIKALLC
jgi:hypothetical protein